MFNGSRQGWMRWHGVACIATFLVACGMSAQAVVSSTDLYQKSKYMDGVLRYRETHSYVEKNRKLLFRSLNRVLFWVVRHFYIHFLPVGIAFQQDNSHRCTGTALKVEKESKVYYRISTNDRNCRIASPNQEFEPHPRSRCPCGESYRDDDMELLRTIDRSVGSNLKKV
jgi:hypothetical protein